MPLLISVREKQHKINTTLWGFYGHKRINRLAIFTLPPEMFGFYKEHLEYITEHAVDPDKRRYAIEGEAQRHYIDIDHYSSNGENPFEQVPKKWEEAVAKFTEDTLQAYGIIPWYIKTMKFKLQNAFENKNVDLNLYKQGLNLHKIFVCSLKQNEKSLEATKHSGKNSVKR